MLSVQDVDLTPNPQALKFVLNQKLLQRETRNYKSKEEAASDPLAKGIFEIPGVVSLFYMDKFITIEKEPSTQWGQIQRPFVEFIKNFELASIPAEIINTESSNVDETVLLKKINEILDHRVRPAAGHPGQVGVEAAAGPTRAPRAAASRPRRLRPLPPGQACRR